MTIQARQYQTDMKLGIYDSWARGNKNVLAVLPTGGGKSHIISDIALEKHQLGATQAIMAHRTELVGQMSLHVANRGIKHRIIAPKPTVAQIVAEHRRNFNGRSFINPDANCSVGAVQTIIARKNTLEQWAAQVDDWTVDECHHVLKHNIWGKVVDLFPNANGLGVTATPRRADGMGLGRHHDGVFDDMILGPTMRDLIDMGYLCDYEIAIPDSDFEIDESLIAKSGDWSTARMKDASKKSHIVGDVVKEYCSRALGKRFICFATDVETAGKMAEQFNNVGIRVAAVSAKTPTDVRNDYIRRFRAGELMGLVNVDLFGEGFDVPAVEVVIMARPTASLAVFLQQFGRALRILAGKQFGLVIDHVSNWKRHGFPDKSHLWSLDRRDKRAKSLPDPDDIPLTACTNCSRPYERFYPACPHCGFEPPLPDPASRTLEQVDGDLVLLDRDMLAAMRKAIELESPTDMGQRVGSAAGPLAAAGAVNRQIERHASQQRLTAAINQWAGIERHKGRQDRETHRRFYLALGIDVLSALAQSRQDMDKLSETVERWCGL